MKKIQVKEMFVIVDKVWLTLQGGIYIFFFCVIFNIKIVFMVATGKIQVHIV